MREILFRGKDPENGKWYEGQYIHLHKTTYCFDTDYAANPDNDIHQIVFERMTDWCLPNQHFRADVDPATVGQYTGLKDKNGKRIFEGDIVHYLYEPGEGYWNSDQRSVIEWQSTGFYMRGIMGTNKYACSTGWLISTPHGDGKYFEVIGNIHDNPEMIR